MRTPQPWGPRGGEGGPELIKPAGRYAAAAHGCGVRKLFVYVKDLLDHLLAGETNYDPLRPHVCKQSQPDVIRMYRVEKRQARTDAKAIKQAYRRIAKGVRTGSNRLHPLRKPRRRWALTPPAIGPWRHTPLGAVP